MSGSNGKREAADLAAEVERDLRAVRQLLRKPLETAIASGGLTGPQQAAMAALVKSAGMSLKELSKELGLAHSTVSGIVDRLQKRGLLERKTDETDLRVTKIVPTRPVRQFVHETLPQLEMHPLTEALEGATDTERQSIVRGVRALRRVLERRAGNGR